MHLMVKGWIGRTAPKNSCLGSQLRQQLMRCVNSRRRSATPTEEFEQLLWTQEAGQRVVSQLYGLFCQSHMSRFHQLPVDIHQINISVRVLVF